MDIFFDRTQLPVLAECDVAVIGGSFGGVATALTLARAGRDVTLVEPRTYLGREVGATLRPWIRVPENGESSDLPEVVAACIEAGGTSAEKGEIPLHMDAVKIELEDILLDAGVEIIYASLPVGLSVHDGRIRGVIIGNKSGRQAITCWSIIDATVTGLVARLAGAEFETPPEETGRFACTLEFTGVEPLEADTLLVPDYVGLVNDRIQVHTGYRGADHILLEYRMDLPRGESDPLAGAARDSTARQHTESLAEYLISEVPAFAEAYLATWSYELDGPHTSPMAGPPPTWAEPLPSVILDDAWGGEGAEVPVATFAGPVGGLWCLNEAARLGALARRLRDPVVAADLGTTLGEILDDHWNIASGASAASVAAMPPEESTGTERGLQVKEQEKPQVGRDYPSLDVEPSPIPVLRSADVVVVGGGTSGAVSGVITAKEGLETVIVDMNPGLGGTGTYGGIYTYWFARRIGFVEQVMSWVDEKHTKLNLPKPEGVMARWNIEAKSWALADEAEEAGAELLMNAYAIATLVEDGAVRGVVVATRWGPVALLTEVVIDGTGDGDVAAFAGADAVYGSDREHTVMYAYLPQVVGPGRPRNVKTSMIDTSNVRDYTRTLMAERRRGVEGDHDHGVYIGPRESRHIKGEVWLTFTDQLVLRAFPDVAFIAFSNHDMKGESTSDWIRMGFQAPNIEIEIPYRALVPRNLDNILVVGKAYSATHDALAGPRMMPDLENLGGVAAVAAAMALKSGKRVRDIDVRALQERLVDEGALPERVLTRELFPLDFDEDQLRSMIDALDPKKPLHTYSDSEIGEYYPGRVPPIDIMCTGPKVVPLLEEALDQAEADGDVDRQVLLAQMLAVLGSKAGVPVLVSEMQERLSGDKLPGREGKVRHAGRNPPNQGAAPEPASLLYSLGMARDPRVLPVWERVVELLEDAAADEILDPVEAWYYYISYLAYGAERLGDPAAVPLLSRLHSYPPVHNQMALSGFQSDHLPERLAYLEVLIGRALARSGSPEGYLILINYLDDTRTLLAEHAHSELVSITGEDFGKNPSRWSEWLEREGDDLKSAPWTEPTEPVAAWEEEILIEEEG